MKVTVNSQRLAAELRLLNKIVPSKPTIPILSHVLMTATDKLGFWATDLEVGLSTSCDAQIHEPGTVALPAAKLLAFVEQFADGPVILASEKQQVTIRCGSFVSRIQALSDADFPSQPKIEGVSSVIPGGALQQLIARTRYAIDTGDSKYMLKGALLALAGPVAAMVATDGKRLALATTSRTGPDVQAIIPMKALDALAAHVAGDCEVTIGERGLYFASGSRLLMSRMLDGRFPAYERIIPRNNDKVIVVNRAALTAALRRIVIASEESRATYLSISQGSIGLSSESAEIGSAEEDVQIDYTGGPLKVCVNGDFMLDFLNAAAQGTVTLSLKDANSAMLLTDGDDHIGVVMLMRG